MTAWDLWSVRVNHASFVTKELQKLVMRKIKINTAYPKKLTEPF